MPTNGTGGPGLAVVAGDVLALRGTGLAAAETWALLCQAAQALQDLFLSNGGVVGGSRTGPVVTPHTLELTSRGRVLLQLAPPETARAYLPPEYRPGRVYSDTDSEKMWMYSLGRALLDTTPRVAALMGTVSVSPSSALQSVLAAMTEPDPRRRASLMNLLDVISEYCRTRLQTKPFTHIVMDMYREVVRSPQYAARKRAYYQLNTLYPARNIIDQSNQQKIYGHHQHQPQRQQQDYVQVPPANGQAAFYHHSSTSQQRHHQQQQQDHGQQQPPPPPLPKKSQPKDHRHRSHNHHAKETRFKAQSRNSQSHPNLTSLGGTTSSQQQQRQQEATLNACRMQFQSQLDIQSGSRSIGPSTTHRQRRHHHSRTYSQPVYTRLQHTRSSGNLLTTVGSSEGNPGGNIYSDDPIYAMPVKPFLSSQDVRVNGLLAKAPAAAHHDDDIYGSSSIGRHQSNTGCSQPDMTSRTNERLREDIYGRAPSGRMCLQRQHSNPQLPSKAQADEDFKRLSQPSVATTDLRCTATTVVDSIVRKEEQTTRQQNPVSSMRLPVMQGPPKPPRIITTLRRTALSDSECNSQTEPPAKPPRIMVRNGPRARRGKAVQRAPSRLYRTVGGPMRCFNKAQCVGPEFVVRANQPPKTLCVGQVKVGNSGRIIVIMLTGQRVEVTCDPQKVTAGDLFQAIVQAESLDENFTLGLAVLLAGDFAMLPPDTKLNKVAPPGWLSSSSKNKGLLGLPTSFMLYLRLRFFLPSLRGVRNWISKHLLYLQIRRCILEQQLVCPYNELINLTGLALQAEFGNYNVNEHGCGDYFLLEHYVPESLIMNADRQQLQSCVEADVLRAQLHRAHRDRRGLDSNKAEEMFITHAQSLPDYGSHYYIATIDSKELEKLMAQQKRSRSRSPVGCKIVQHQFAKELFTPEELFSRKNCATYRKSRLPVLSTYEDTPMIPYSSRDEACNNNNNNNHNNNSVSSNNNKNSKSGKKKTESNVWLAIHAQGLKLLERGGESRERTELAHFQWRDVQTLSYSKSCLVVYSKLNGKRCKFKLRMDHRKSYFAFKLTSLHHQFFVGLRSELTSLQGLAKNFGVPLATETKATPSKSKVADSKTKIAIANTMKGQQRVNYPMQLEEYQNKENENPQKDANVAATKDFVREPGFYSSEEDALYAQVNIRLEPEGQSRDTEEESDRGLTTPEGILLDSKETRANRRKLFKLPKIERLDENGEIYSRPKPLSINITELDEPNNPEELYAAINKVRLSRKSEYSAPDEDWKVSDVKKTLQKMKTSSLPNYGTPRQSGGFRTPSLPRRLGVKMGTRAIYSSLVQKDTALTDDTESLSVKSDTESSIQSLSAQSAESPMPEAYVLNADIRTDDETFRVPQDESISASLMARLDEMSFAEERNLHTIKLERGHGGSIGLQVTEGIDGGVYVQAVSVGGSADMAGNINKGDRIVAINGQNLLNLRYEDALKMLQSSSETIELVLSQVIARKSAESKDEQGQGHAESNYLQDIRFDVSSEAETSSMTNKWIAQKTTDVASVQNTSSAYSSAASSAMGNHNANSLYMTDLVDNNALKSASMLLSIEDFDLPVSLSVADKGDSTMPPVPPRRTKRKIKISSITTSTTIENTNDPKLEQKRPPLPPLPEKCRWSKSRSAEPYKPQCDTANCPSAETVVEHDRNVHIDTTKSKIEAKSPRSDDTTCTRGNSTGGTNDDPIPRSTSTATSKPSSFLSRDVAFTKRNTRDKYPPLFFTMNDYQNVMFSARRTDDPTTITMDPDRLRNSSEKEESSTMTRTLDVDDDVCFRVTTTNLPFERCLERWSLFDDCDNEFAQKLKKNADGEDVQMNIWELSGFDVSNNNDGETERRIGAKVRFAESPDPTTFEDKVDVEVGVQCDGSRSCELRLNDEEAGERSVASSVKLTEIRDGCTDVRDFDGDSPRRSRSSNTVENNFVEKRNEPFIPTDETYEIDPILQTRCNDKDNDVNCKEIDQDFNSTLLRQRVSGNENSGIKEEQMAIVTGKVITSEENTAVQIDQSQVLETSLEITENTSRLADKSLKACKTAKANAAEVTLKRTERDEEIFLKETSDDIKERSIAKNEKVIDDSLRDVSSNKVNQKDDHDDGSDEKSSINDITRKSLKTDEASSSEEDKVINDFLDSKNNSEQASSKEEIFEKNVPVKVRRNSFLETMLASDSTDFALNCAIDVAHTTMSSSPNMDIEINASSERENEERRLDMGVARGNGCSCELNKADARNQNVLKSSKEIKRKIAVSAVDVKSTQSESKSAGAVKNDVLNELLCNFSNIKLKIVNPESKKTPTKVSDIEDISHSTTIDNRIFTKEDLSSRSKIPEKSRDEIREVSAKTISIDANNDTTIDERIAKEDITAKIEDKTKNPEDDISDPTVVTDIAKHGSIKTTKPEGSSSDVAIAKDAFLRSRISEKSSDVKSEEIRMETKIKNETSEGTEGTDRQLKPKKSRDIRTPKTILKNKSAEYGRQASGFQKRIPIGAPATMNKIFDSRELEVMSHASRRSSLEGGKKREEASKETHGYGDEKTEEEIIVDEEADSDQMKIASRSVLALESSSDKCAIARKTTSVTPCNNNDNNRAVTPVAISNDQSSRDVVTITPGKVRSFVKYYEIRSDATTERHSKINDREKVTRRKFTSNKATAPPVAVRDSQRPEVTTGRKIMREGGSVKSNSDALKAPPDKTRLSWMPEDPLDLPAVCETTEMGSEVSKKHERNLLHVSGENARAQHVKAGAKKSVQFRGGFTVIHSRTFDEDESAGIVAGCDASSLRKRRAPERPSPRDSNSCQKLVREITKSEKLPNDKKGFHQRRQAVDQIHAVAGHTENSGINRFVPKPETPQLVFYCTV